jgi:hypothetical protein
MAIGEIKKRTMKHSLRIRWLRRLVRWFPIRWLYMDYSPFRIEFRCLRVRGRIRAWFTAKAWVLTFPSGSVEVSRKRPRWERNNEPVPINEEL